MDTITIVWFLLIFTIAILAIIQQYKKNNSAEFPIDLLEQDEELLFFIKNPIVSTWKQWFILFHFSIGLRNPIAITNKRIILSEEYEYSFNKEIKSLEINKAKTKLVIYKSNGSQVKIHTKRAEEILKKINVYIQ